MKLLQTIIVNLLDFLILGLILLTCNLIAKKIVETEENKLQKK